MRTLLFLLVLPIAMYAQQPQPDGARFNPQEFQQRMEQALTREACFTTEEAAAFFPLYNEMRQKQRALGDQIRDIKRQVPGAGSEADYLNAITRIKQLQVEIAQLEQDYYHRLCRAVPAAKVFKAMQAEDKFHRNMLREGRTQNRRNGYGRQQGGNQPAHPHGGNN